MNNIINSIIIVFFYIQFGNVTQDKVRLSPKPCEVLDTLQLQLDTIKVDTLVPIKQVKLIKTKAIDNSNVIDSTTFEQEGIASYYAHKYHGRKTASGEIYNMNSLTAAHFTLPFGTMVKVTNLDNNLTVVVKINDKGPFPAKKNGNAITDKLPHSTRIIDLSLAAMKEIDAVNKGHVNVKLEKIK